MGEVMTLIEAHTNKFIDLLNRHQSTGKTRHIVGVYDCVSARIAEQVGFEGVWLSSLAMSVVNGVCDRNELSWIGITDTVERVAECCELPIILDGDEGFGSDNIARLFAKRSFSRGAACVSFEDKTFPKKNSFDEGVSLCSIPEFTSKIAACRDVVEQEAGAILARTDSLVADEDVRKTIDRAHAYHEAGADAVIIHSKHNSVDQLARFMSLWSGACPIVAIPTSFDQTEPEIFDQLGVSCVVWANQLLRSSIKAMQNTAQVLFQQKHMGALNGNLISVKETLGYADCGLGCAS